jgi:hypothetical protein
MKTSVPDRIFLLLTGLLAAYQLGVGIDGFATLPIVAYTIGYGVLLVASLLLLVLGFQILESPAVVIISSILPLSLSLGLVWQHMPTVRLAYLAFAILGFLAIALTRSLPLPGKLATLVLALTHAISGLVIFLLPILMSLQGQMGPAFSLVGLGGALIGLGGLLLSFLKAGRPLLSRETILKLLPALLLLMTLFFVAGSRYG